VDFREQVPALLGEWLVGHEHFKARSSFVEHPLHAVLMYVWIWILIYTCIHTHIFLHMPFWVSGSFFTNTSQHVCAFVEHLPHAVLHMCVCTDVCVYTYIHTSARTKTCTHIYTTQNTFKVVCCACCSGGQSLFLSRTLSSASHELDPHELYVHAPAVRRSTYFVQHSLHAVLTYL